METKKLIGIVAAASLASSGATAIATKQPPPPPPEPIIKYEPVPIGKTPINIGFDPRGQTIRIEVPLPDGGYLYQTLGLNTP